MNAKLALCALGTNLIGWIAVANERLSIITTTFVHMYAYALVVFAMAAIGMILVGRAFGDVIKSRPSDWHLVVLAAVPKPVKYVFGILAGGAVAYMFFVTGGSASADSWESAGPGLRSVMFAGFSIPAALAWIALVATSKAAV